MHKQCNPVYILVILVILDPTFTRQIHTLLYLHKIYRTQILFPQYISQYNRHASKILNNNQSIPTPNTATKNQQRTLHLRREEEVSWIYPHLVDMLRYAGLQIIGTHIGNRQNTLSDWEDMRMILYVYQMVEDKTCKGATEMQMVTSSGPIRVGGREMGCLEDIKKKLGRYKVRQQFRQWWQGGRGRLKYGQNNGHNSQESKDFQFPSKFGNLPPQNLAEDKGPVDRNTTTVGMFYQNNYIT